MLEYIMVISDHVRLQFQTSSLPAICTAINSDLEVGVAGSGLLEVGGCWWVVWRWEWLVEWLEVGVAGSGSDQEWEWLEVGGWRWEWLEVGVAGSGIEMQRDMYCLHNIAMRFRYWRVYHQNNASKRVCSVSAHSTQIHTQQTQHTHTTHAPQTRMHTHTHTHTPHTHTCQHTQHRHIHIYIKRLKGVSLP